MITITNLSLKFREKPLFKDVSLKFMEGNCYGIIGANGAGKSTFLKVLSGELQADTGEISITTGKRLAMLRQDHFAFDSFSVKDTVYQGHPKLYQINREREAIYAKEDFSESDGLRAAELEEEFASLGGWESENQVEQLLSGLGLEEEHHNSMMSNLSENQKVRVLLAQAIFGSPDILLLDEPTNGLDLESIHFLEDFLMDFPNIVIVVSHDRHFLNSVCTHICDIDYTKIRLYSGNYDFWYQMSQIMQRQAKDMQKRREDKMKDLREFILRFASNASKSRQATSRKKIYDKLALEEIEVTSRKFPYVHFQPNREIGNNVLNAENISYMQKREKGERVLLSNFSLTVNRTDKIAFVGQEHLSKTCFFNIISGAITGYEKNVKWGQTTSFAYLPKDNAHFFETDLNIVDWLRQFSKEQDEGYIRGFLGRMLFSGDEGLKPVKVLSGGEKVRCMLSRLMLSGANVLILDEPTNHLDLEAITSLNNALMDFRGVVLFNSHDREFISSVANRIIEITPNGIIDKMMGFEEYIENEEVNRLREDFYAGSIKKVQI